MKKLSLIILLGLTSTAKAGLITHSDYTAGTSITASAQNSNENTVFNEFNGNIESTNIKDGTIVVADLSTTVQAQFVPTGSVFEWAGSSNSIPSGYLYCNGQAVSRTTYAALFTAIGTAYGSGNGSTTFNVPDMRGYFARGVSDDSSNDPDKATRTASASGGNTGNNVGSVEISTISAHTHTATSVVTDPGHNHTERFGGGGGAQNNIVGATANTPPNDANSTNTTASATTGVTVATTNANTGGNETRPKNLYFFYIIKS